MAYEMFQKVITLTLLWVKINCSTRNKFGNKFGRDR